MSESPAYTRKPLSAQLLTVRHDSGDGVALVAADGEIDISTTPMLTAALARAMRCGVSTVVVDLTDVTFIDSSGAELLITTSRQLGAQGRRFAVVCSEGGVVHRSLALIGVLAILTVHSSRAGAIAGGRDLLADPGRPRRRSASAC